jgi:MarR family transcriptional regulator for hemolysin
MDTFVETDLDLNPNESLGYLCRIAFRNLSRALERRTLPHGVSSGQWRFLRMLWIEDGITQRELSRRVGLREPTTVTALKGLEKAGFIHRWQSPDDRRKLHVYLTPKARQLRATLAPYVVEVNEKAVEGLTPEEVRTLRDLLRKVANNLSEESEAALDSSV